MSQPSPYIWSIYGKFMPGAHGLPRVGDLIHYYRLYRGKTKEEVATVLACSSEMLDDLEQHRLPLDDGAKREALVTALAIAPLLLGLPPYDATLRSPEDLTPEEFNELIVASGAPVVDPLITETYMSAFDLLSNARDISASSRERALTYWIQHLFQCIALSTGIACDQYRAIAYEFLLSAGWQAMKQGDLVRACAETTSALEQGYHLANTELLISALDQRIDILLKQKQEALAIQDFEVALRYAEVFYQVVNHQLLRDASCASEISSCYTKIGDAISEKRLVEQMRELYDRTLSVILEGQKAQPTEVFPLLSRRRGEESTK
jgi:hypothetical protein